MPAARFKGVIGSYLSVLKDEPKMRMYLLAQLIDDAGTAASLWGGQLIMARIFADQRIRASVMIPILVSQFLGIALGGPLADWVRSNHPKAFLRLARWRWKLVVIFRTIETVGLAMLITNLTLGEPTVARLLPYFVVSTLVRTGLISTRVAFEVDLLQKEEVQVGEDGVPLLDEYGKPRMYKTHLLSMVSMLAVLNATATLGGLIIGGSIMDLVGDAYWVIFVIDVLTNSGYIVIVFLACHPAKALGSVRLSDLGRDPDAEASSQPSYFVEVTTRFARSVASAVTFLRARAQRPLLWMFLGGVVLDATAQTFDDKMLMLQIIKVPDDVLRHSELFWSLLAIAFPAALPVLRQRIKSLGKLFIATMCLDGLIIAVAGHLSTFGPPHLAPHLPAFERAAVVFPLVLVLGMDRGLNVTTKSLIALAQNSASSPAMRGRLASAYLLAITGANILVHLVATQVSEAIGIPRMILFAGLLQVVVVIAFGVAAKRTLWRFGLKT